MEHSLVVSRALLDRVRAELAKSPGDVVEVRAGRRRHAGGIEWIAPLVRPDPAIPSARVRFYVVHERMQGMSAAYLRALPHFPVEGTELEVALYPGRGASAFVSSGTRIDDLTVLRIRGAGMETWTPSAAAPELEGARPRDGRFSRYIGALGGTGVHTRLRELRVAVCGVSRTGSLLATHLARAGVARIALIDPDVVEEHLLDAMDVLGARRIGRPKVAAVREHLREIAPEGRVEAIPTRLEDPAGLAAALEADVLVTTADSHRPRVLAAAIAAAYGKIHVDVGTGVLRSPRGVEVGVDVRVVTPGTCILCNGGVAVPRAAAPEDWREAREGSLRSLNGIASSYAMLLLEQLVRGDLDGSAWCTLRFEPGAREAFVRHRIRTRSGCPCCAHCGYGDAQMKMSTGVRTAEERA